VHSALIALRRQIRDRPVPVYAYIEIFNYRYRMNDAQRMDYFRAQLNAVADARAQGFYVWSVGNHYDLLFEAMRQLPWAKNEKQVEHAAASPANGPH
jgi:hypothetical protein